MKIYIEPTGGLCDRIATIEWFLNQKDILAINLHLIWNLNNDLNCKFEYLFKDIKDVKVTNQKLSFIQKHRFTRRLLNLILKQFRGTKIDLYQVERIRVLELLNQKKKVWFTGFIFDEIRDKMYFDEFTPIPAMQKKLLVQKKSTNVIGVHIRRTDNVIAIQNSPTDLFYKALDSEIALNNDVTFYCATDSEEELNNLIKKYGNKIKYQTNCIRSRNSKEGIESALIDLLSLSNCSKIIGSDWSAFSGVAAKIGKIELQRIKKTN